VRSFVDSAPVTRRIPSALFRRSVLQPVSRCRQRLWVKGEPSDQVLELVAIGVDCDRAPLLVRQAHGPTCHLDRCSCFVQAPGDFLAKLDPLGRWKRR